jgi:molybdate transport repressor ModE-like protein
MAGSKGDKYYDIFLDYSLYLKTIENMGIMDESDFLLLKEIGKMGSIKLASEKVQISYRKAWNIIDNSEKLLGFKLVEKSRGGKDGGHTTLSPEGKNLVGAYLELKEEINHSIKKITQKFFHTINQQIT